MTYTIFTAFIIGFLYLLILRLLAGIIVYVTIVLIIAGSIAGGLAVFIESGNLPAGDPNVDNYKYVAYVFWGFAAICVICVICNWKNIKIGIAIMKATAVFVATTP